MKKNVVIIACIVIIAISVITYFLTHENIPILPVPHASEHTISNYAVPGIYTQSIEEGDGGYASITSTLVPPITLSSTPYTCQSFRTQTTQNVEIQINGKKYCVNTTSDGYMNNGITNVTFTYTTASTNRAGTESVNFNTAYQECSSGMGNGDDVCAEEQQFFEENLNTTASKLLIN
jgi:hypothetical protein